MTAVIVHLSDIHIKNVADPILKRAKEIAACTYSSLPLANAVFMVVSGDIAFSGLPEQYDLATSFLNQIKMHIETEAKVQVHFLISPGNHDCDFERDNAARKSLIRGLLDSSQPEVDDSVILGCCRVQEAFFAFRNAIEGDSSAEDDRLWRTRRFDLEGKELIFDCLNISWVSQLKEDQGRLYFPHERYLTKSMDNADVRVVVMHHPLNWFGQNTYRPFRAFIRKLANVIVSGHEHQGNVGENFDSESAGSAYVEGCILQGEHDLTDSAFNIVVIDIDQGQYRSMRHAWMGTRYEPTEEGSWADYRDLPAKRQNPFQTQQAFLELLEDPGAFFRHPSGINLCLADMYVYPDMKHIGTRDEKVGYISSSKLLNPEMTATGVLIEGEEKSGRTSLLYQLFAQYHDRGFVPLLLRGKNLRKHVEKGIESALQRAVVEQYGDAAVTAFEQTEKEKKVLLLDDFDDGPIKEAKARSNILCSLKKRFGHLVVTVGEMFEVREVVRRDEASEICDFQHYKLQPFGYVLRSRLVKRWYRHGSDGSIDEGTFIARCDQAERAMNAVMTRSIIPSVPLYLLTLMQSLEMGHSGDFQEGALGHYYHYLLTEGYGAAGVRKEKLTEIFQYSTQLAWYFHSQGKGELSESELREFNVYFSKKWHTVDFSSRLEVLVRSKVLCKRGQDYAFRYPYIYFYLKGKYLSETLADLETQAYIGKCCKHLYVREHAHTILFLAHHATDDYVLNCIVQPLHGSFKNLTPISFNGDTQEVAKLINDAPTLTYVDDSPEKHRDESNAIRDQLDDGSDGLAEKEEAHEELSLIAQLTVLFKTVEILGQILKDQYSRITRERKVEVINELFAGPLRALRDFFQFLEKNPDHLVSEIEAVLQKKGGIDEEERKSIAKRVVAAIIQMVSTSLMFRTSQAVGSDSLAEDIREVVRRNGTLAYKLIELGVLLDSPKAIPRELLRRLIEEAKDDLVASRTIQLLVFNRLYMFKTSIEDKQWLAEKVSIGMSAQRAIEFTGTKARRVK
jgi:hypothetical protein